MDYWLYLGFGRLRERLPVKPRSEVIGKRFATVDLAHNHRGAFRYLLIHILYNPFGSSAGRSSLLSTQHPEYLPCINIWLRIAFGLLGFP